MPRCFIRCFAFGLTIVLTSATATPQSADRDTFTIRVVDDETNRGVPLVELKTVNDASYYTDSAGHVAIREQGLLDQTIFFHVSSHGYEFPQDGFGYRGTRLRITPGGEKTIRIKRLNIAERIYRVTGADIYRDTLLAGKTAPIQEPLLNAQVYGSDSVVNAIYQGKIYWFWGDTNRPSYPLGNFHVPGATSFLPDQGGLDPDVGVDLEYFVGDNGFAKPTAELPGQGPTWINGLVTLNDESGKERLFAAYVKIKPPLTVYQKGLAEFSDATQQFDKVAEFDLEAPLFPYGHPFVRREDGVEYVYFGDPFPLVRVRATPEHLRDLSRYEAYTCLAAGSRDDSWSIVRENGQLQFAWRSDALPFTPQLQARLHRDGMLTLDEGLFRLRDESDKPVMIHRGTVRWNEFRQRWIMIGIQQFGTSLLGEVWFAEAEQMVGPWKNARKIVTHDQYSFYNPKHHEIFDQDGGRLIYFEGTYTNTFSGNDHPTPRYNYNQIMYRLDLSDPRLKIGVRKPD